MVSLKVLGCPLLSGWRGKSRYEPVLPLIIDADQPWPTRLAVVPDRSFLPHQLEAVRLQQANHFIESHLTPTRSGPPARDRWRTPKLTLSRPCRKIPPDLPSTAWRIV